MIPGQKLLYTAFLMLLVNAFICTQSEVVAAADGIAASSGQSDDDRRMTFSFAEPDCKVRLTADDLMNAVCEVAD